MRLHPVYRYLVFTCFIVLVTGCSSTVRAPVTNGTSPPGQAAIKDKTRPAGGNTVPIVQTTSGFHVVASGDTLYSIAWRYDQDYRDIAEWNHIRSPYVIFPGQLIRLKPEPGRTQEPARTLTVKPETTQTKPQQPGPVAATKEVSPAVTTKTTQPDKIIATGPVKWQWPAQGKILKLDSPTSRKGIDISGTIGQQVRAAATGDVVYSGSGLLGYGKLIIIKHSDRYLSAYAYNSQLLVKEGDSVKAGQDIARMGQGNNGLAMLHFEIRKDGKPVNPLDMLPRQRS